MVAAGGDVGAAAEAPVEPILAEAPAEEAAKEEAPVEEAAKEEASAEEAAKEEQASA